MEDDALAAELDRRRERDQQARTRQPIDWDEVATVDADNTAWLADYLDRHGWPLRSRVGEEAAAAAWLLAQHADARPDFQHRCLDLLAAAVADGEADPGHLAYLTDRVLRADGLPQRYGTQFWTDPDTGRLEPQPVEDPGRLDQRRAAVGLEPFADYQRAIRDADD